MASDGCDFFGLPPEVVEWCNNAPYIVQQAREHADAISLANQLGRLDLISVILAVFGVLLGVAALFGFWAVRRDAIAKAKETTETVVPDELARYLKENGASLVREALKNAETVSAIQAEVMRLGIRDAPSADEVDAGDLAKEADN